MKLFWPLFIFLITACNNASNNSSSSEKTKADSLMDQVMEGHNNGMAKAMKVHQLQKNLKETIDSISQLSTVAQKNIAGYKLQLDSALSRLNFADYAMNKWMEEFSMDSFSNNNDKRIEYLNSEKLKISKVEDALTGSLRRADSLLNKK